MLNDFILRTVVFPGGFTVLFLLSTNLCALNNLRGNLLLLRLLIARLSTETAAFVSFRLLRRQCVCF